MFPYLSSPAAVQSCACVGKGKKVSRILCGGLLGWVGLGESEATAKKASSLTCRTSEAWLSGGRAPLFMVQDGPSGHAPGDRCARGGAAWTGMTGGTADTLHLATTRARPRTKGNRELFLRSAASRLQLQYLKP
jgi:hypothetical protein